MLTRSHFRPKFPAANDAVTDSDKIRPQIGPETAAGDHLVVAEDDGRAPFPSSSLPLATPPTKAPIEFVALGTVAARLSAGAPTTAARPDAAAASCPDFAAATRDGRPKMLQVRRLHVHHHQGAHHDQLQELKQAQETLLAVS